MIDLDRNHYATNPFNQEKEEPSLRTPDPESDLTVNVSGMAIMNTKNIRRKLLESNVGDLIAGVSGRWTLFTQLLRVGEP